MTIAFSGVWQMNAWHSNCFDCWFCCFDRITTVKIGACEPEERRRRSDGLKVFHLEIIVNSLISFALFIKQTSVGEIAIFCPGFRGQWLAVERQPCLHFDSIQISPLTTQRYCGMGSFVIHLQQSQSECVGLLHKCPNVRYSDSLLWNIENSNVDLLIFRQPIFLSSEQK